MLKIIALFSSLFISYSAFTSTVLANSEEDVIAAFERGETVTGWVHAAVNKYQQYVFTWRNPQNFFEAFEYPMIPGDDSLHEVFSTLHRHDKIEVTGQLFETSAGQRHLWTTGLKVLEPFTPAEPMPPHQPVETPSELLGQTEAIFSVHAVLQDGKVVVLDYKDAILPLIVKDPNDTAGLFRYDKVRIRYKIRQHPGAPAHLELLSRMPNQPNITVLRRVTDGHDQPIELEGDLVLFPKSPQIKFNVFALRHIDEDGVKTHYTLVNFEDMQLFENLRAQLQQAWDQSTVEAINDRNKLVKPGLTVHAKGIKNIVSPNQANPQILVNALSDVTLKTP